MLKETLNFKFYHKKSTPLSSLCPWICMVEDGICKLKGEALMCAYEFIAPDIASCSIGKINSISNMINNALIQLGSNWTIQFELQRESTNDYPGSSFDNLAGFLIERERELNFHLKGNHFLNRYFLIFTYYLPSQVETKVKNLFFKKNNDTSQQQNNNSQNDLRVFKMNTGKIARLLSTIMYIEKLNSEKLLELLHSSVSLDWHKMNLPTDYNLFIDNVVTDTDLENSMPLKLGKYYIPIICVKSFPSVTIPAMFDVINKADCELRWSTRFCCYSKEEAYKRIESAEKKFHSQRKSIAQIAMESTILKGEGSGRENSAAIAEESDAADAKIDLTMGYLGFGDYTSNIMVWDKDIDEAHAKAEHICGLVTACGFSAKEETLNCLPAFLSMQPGNIYANRRSLFVSTGNVSHVIPISSIWSGLCENNFMKDICGQKHPHLICDTEFGIPFYLNLNIRDVGHTWISGGTGAGKSTLLALLEAQWLKYPNAQVIIFDKGKSSKCLTMCVGGTYIEPGKDETTFQPLAEIDSYEGQSWAAEFIEILLVEQKVTVTAGMRKCIFDTIKLLATKDRTARTLTTFQQYCSDYQDPDTKRNDIADGIAPYVLGGQFGSLFDSESENLSIHKWTMFEMESLMNMSSEAVAPALDYLFMQCEKKFNGNPTLLVLDEAWIYFKNPIFANKIVEWLKVLRKKHVFVVFATQELADAIKSPIASTLVSQCPSKIYLADEEALTPMNKETYEKFGLDEAEIKLLSTMQKKQDYLYKSSMGTRRFQLELDQLQLAILTNNTDDLKMLEEIEKKYGRNCGRELVEEILQAKNVEYSYLLED